MSDSVPLSIMLAVAVLAASCSRSDEDALEGEPMVLTLSFGDRVQEPTDRDIRNLLGRLDVARDGEGFAILARDEMTYIQVSGDWKTGFDMEYQEGDVERHYRASREDISLDEAVQAFIDYRDGRIQWDRYGDWSRITW